MNGNTIRFHPQTQKLVQYNMSYFNSQSRGQMVLGLICLFPCGVSGAEIRSVCTEAGMFAIRSRRKVSSKEDLVSLFPEKTLRKSICVLLIFISTAQ